MWILFKRRIDDPTGVFMVGGVMFKRAPLKSECKKLTMQFIQRKVSLNKCLKFKMPKVPKIVVRAFSTIDSIFNRSYRQPTCWPEDWSG